MLIPNWQTRTVIAINVDTTWAKSALDASSCVSGFSANETISD